MLPSHQTHRVARASRNSAHAISTPLPKRLARAVLLAAPQGVWERGSELPAPRRPSRWSTGARDRLCYQLGQAPPKGKPSREKPAVGCQASRRSFYAHSQQDECDSVSEEENIPRRPLAPVTQLRSPRDTLHTCHFEGKPHGSPSQTRPGESTSRVQTCPRNG